MLCGLPFPEDPNLMVGMREPDDAGVYRIREDLALIQTVDFFTPLVDDPYIFGQIAAVNSLSDVYAMGGKPLTALNILCFPIKKLDVSDAREIIRGGLEKVNEAGALLVGGHSVIDDELKFGLSVTGVIHPDRVVRKGGARAGDVLVLTKAIGTGVIATALKGDMASQEYIDEMVRSMTTLNKAASSAMQKAGPPHACTDITGFGLVGHLYEILHTSGLGGRLRAGAVPFLKGALDYAAQGLLAGGLHRNRDFYKPMVRAEGHVDEDLLNLLFDPQTSGGLLIVIQPDRLDSLLAELKHSGVEVAAVVGEVLEGPAGEITIIQ